MKLHQIGQLIGRVMRLTRDRQLNVPAQTPISLKTSLRVIFRSSSWPANQHVSLRQTYLTLSMQFNLR